MGGGDDDDEKGLRGKKTLSKKKKKKEKNKKNSLESEKFHSPETGAAGSGGVFRNLACVYAQGKPVLAMFSSG